MLFVTVKEAADRWGVSPRQVQRLIAQQRIAGAEKHGRAWLIPADTEKPEDLRKNKSDEYIIYTATYFPAENPDKLNDMVIPRLRPLVSSLLAYYRGDFEGAKKCFREVSEEDDTKLTSTYIAVTAAMVTGDTILYDEIQRYLRSCLSRPVSENSKILLQYPFYIAAANMSASEMLPQWLKNGQISSFSADIRPLLLQVYMMYLRDSRQYDQLMAAAKTAYSISAVPGMLSVQNIQYCVLCAFAANALGNVETAEEYIYKAAEQALPHGFIAPFADYLLGMGGVMERVLEQEYPQQLGKIIETAGFEWKNLIRFHNKYARTNVTTILTPQEYHVALLLARGATYSQAAERLHLSQGHIRNIASDIYSKLGVKNRREMKDFIL